MPTLQFLGAAGTVTGSKYLLEAAGERLMIDCGLFQGEKALRLRNWQPLPTDPAGLRWLALTHAHLDHTGYIPRLVRQGFRGAILSTPATMELAKLLLPDSGHLQEEDAAYANKKGFSKHSPALPLYTHDEAAKSLERFQAIDESKPLELSPHFTLRFFRAGHILGARMIHVTVRENGRSCRILFSGDLGRSEQLIILPPVVPEPAETLLLESTYGDSLHPTDDPRIRLANLVEATAARGGKLIIPAFAVGRTQELLYLFRELVQGKQIHTLPIHVDSPMAIDVTDLYRRHHEDHNLATEKLESGGLKLFSQPNVKFDRTVEESKALNDASFPAIIISASGMATGGRVLHHLAHCLPDHRNSVLLVGFQAAGTRGQAIQSGAESVKIHGQSVPIRARIETMANLSGHADYGEILDWLTRFGWRPERVYLVHGEPRAAQSLEVKVREKLGWKVEIAQYLEKVELGGNG